MVVMGGEFSLDWIVALVGFVHLLATVIWIGGVFFVMLVFMPAIGRHKELGPAAGMLTVEVSKRFMSLVWASILLFLVTGVPMTILNARFPGFVDISNPWSAVIFVKHIVFAVMVVGALAQTLTIRRMGRLLRPAQTQTTAEKSMAAEVPPEMVKLRRMQIAIGVTVFILGILALLLTAIAQAA